MTMRGLRVRLSDGWCTVGVKYACGLPDSSIEDWCRNMARAIQFKSMKLHIEETTAFNTPSPPVRRTMADRRPTMAWPAMCLKIEHQDGCTNFSRRS